MFFQDAVHHESVSGDESRGTPQHKQNIWKLSQASSSFFIFSMFSGVRTFAQTGQILRILVKWEKYSGWTKKREEGLGETVLGSSKALDPESSPLHRITC